MWEIALLLVAIGFLVLVIFTVPALMQVRDTVKELEFTLRETRESLKKFREIAEKAEDGIDRGREVIGGAGKVVVAIDDLLGKSGTKYFTKGMTMALEFTPMVMAALKLYRKYADKGGEKDG